MLSIISNTQKKGIQKIIQIGIFTGTSSVVFLNYNNVIPMTRITNMQYLAAASLLAVFVINIAVPPSFVIDILYLCSIVLVFKQNSKTILGFSIAAAVLILINTIFFEWSIN